MTITIMGHKWKIKDKSPSEDRLLMGCYAYCDFPDKTIIISNPLKAPVNNQKAMRKEVLRHEIVHACLEECGLSDETLSTDN